MYNEPLVKVVLSPVFYLGEFAGTIYLLRKFSFANFEFIFAIRDPKLVRRTVEKYN